MNYTNAEPKNMRLTPPGESSYPMSRRFPEIRGGVCEYCGVIDKNYPGDQQYKLCPHYKGMNMKCVFCPDSKDHDEVVRASKMIVMEDPYSPGNLVTLCGSYECTRKFEKKFNITSN